MRPNVTYLSQVEIQKEVHNSCLEEYNKGAAGGTCIPYDKNTYWQSIESKVVDLLEKTPLETSQFQEKFVPALFQANRGMNVMTWRSDLKQDPEMVSRQWRTAAIVASSIATTLLLTAVIVIPTVTFLI